MMNLEQRNARSSKSASTTCGDLPQWPVTHFCSCVGQMRRRTECRDVPSKVPSDQTASSGLPVERTFAASELGQDNSVTGGNMTRRLAKESEL